MILEHFDYRYPMLCNRYDVPGMQVVSWLSPPPPTHTHSLSESHLFFYCYFQSACAGGQLVSSGGLGAFCGDMLKLFCVYSYSFIVRCM